MKLNNTFEKFKALVLGGLYSSLPPKAVFFLLKYSKRMFSMLKSSNIFTERKVVRKKNIGQKDRTIKAKRF